MPAVIESYLGGLAGAMYLLIFQFSLLELLRLREILVHVLVFDPNYHGQIHELTLLPLLYSFNSSSIPAWRIVLLLCFSLQCRMVDSQSCGQQVMGIVSLLKFYFLIQNQFHLYQTGVLMGYLEQ
jgi:hypothetical protein